jgi:hypothetical protein
MGPFVFLGKNKSSTTEDTKEHRGGVTFCDNPDDPDLQAQNLNDSWTAAAPRLRWKIHPHTWHSRPRLRNEAKSEIRTLPLMTLIYTDKAPNDSSSRQPLSERAYSGSHSRAACA